MGTRYSVAAQATGLDFGSVSGLRGHYGVGGAGGGLFENGDGEEGVEEMQDLMNRLGLVQVYSRDGGDRRDSFDVLDDEESDDGGAKL